MVQDSLGLTTEFAAGGIAVTPPETKEAGTIAIKDTIDQFIEIQHGTGLARTHYRVHSLTDRSHFTRN